MKKYFQIKEQNIKNIFKFREYSSVRWWSLFFMLEALTTLGFVIFTAVPNDGDLKEIWFGSLQYFTQQSNILVCIFLICYWIDPQMWIFRRNRLLITLTTYISVTFIGYNFLILPGSLIVGVDILVGKGTLISTIFMHVINPICMISLYSLICYHREAPINISRLKTILKGGLIYPCLYILYAAILPFVTNESVYGPFTNLNPNFIWNDEWPGTPWAGAIMAGMIFVFAGLMWIYWIILKKKINIKKIYQI